MGRRRTYIGGKDECKRLEDQEQKKRLDNRKPLLKREKKNKKTHQDGRKTGLKGRNKRLLQRK